MRTLLPVLVIFSAYFAVAQDSAKPFRLPIHGYQQFEDSLRKNMVYPEDARRKGIQGTVHVHTKLDAEGQIIPETVKVISGLSLSCDSEAIRVVKKYRGKFTFFDAYDPSEAFIFPIKFVLTDLRSMFEPLQP